MRNVVTSVAVVMPGVAALAAVIAAPASAAATAPPGYGIVRAADVPAPPAILNASGQDPPHANTAATATCPTGTVVLSGGALSTDDTTASVLTSLGPQGSHKFTATDANTSSVDQRLTAFAVCAAKPPKYTIVSQSLTDMGPDEPVLAPVCPAGTSVLGGGMKVAGPAFNIPIAGSLDEDRHGWFGEAVHQEATTAMLTGQAICAA